MVCSGSTSVTILAPPSQVVLTALPSQPNCAGALGSVNLSAGGGVGPYVYGGDATVNLTAGVYNYYVIDDNGCSGTASVTTRLHLRRSF